VDSPIKQQLRRVELQRHLREFPLDALEFTKRPAELLALQRVTSCLVIGVTAEREGACTIAKPLHVETGNLFLEAAFAEEDILRRDIAVVEIELTPRIAAHEAGLLSKLEPGHPTFDDNRADAADARTEPHIDKKNVGVRAVGREYLGSVARSSSRPLSVLWLAGSLAAQWCQKLRANGIAVFKSPGAAATAFRKLQLKPRRSHNARTVSPVAAAARACIAGDPGVRSEWRTRRMLALYGFQSPREMLARSPEQAFLAAQGIGGPVALKVQSPLLPHRASAGALLLNLNGEDAVGSGYHCLMARLDPAVKETLEGVLVQAMVKPEHEVLLGVLRDPVFGPVIACGSGGSAAEKQSGVTFIMPDEDRDAVAALLSSKEIGRQIGAAGVATMTDLILRLSQLVTDLGPLLAELDINPVALVCGGTQAIALDALARIGSDPLQPDLDQRRPPRGAQN